MRLRTGDLYPLLTLLFVLGSGIPLVQASPLQEPDPKEKEKADREAQLSERHFIVTVEEGLPLLPREAVTATKLPVSLLETPSSISVVTHPLFRSQDAIILSDALENVSGVNLQSNFGVHDYFYLRGFDSLSSGLVLTDGAAEPEATFYHLYNIDRVEVLKGPAAFLYGGNPLAGAVNLVRKEPQFNRFFQALGTAGSFNTFRGQLDLNLGESDSPVAFRLNLMGQSSDGYRDRLDNYQIAVNPALTWRLSEKSFLTVNFEFVDNEYTPDAGIPLLGNNVPDIPRTRSYGSPLDISDQKIYRLRVDWSTQLRDWVMLRNKFYYTDLNWLSQGTLLNGVFPNMQNNLEVQRVLNSLDNRQRLAGNQFEAVFTFHTGAVRHDLLTGLETSRLGDAFGLDIALLPGIDLLNPVETLQGEPFIIPGQSVAGDSRNIVIAPYFLDRIALTEKVQLFAGGRLDHIDFEDALLLSRREDTRFNPMAGLLLAPRKDLSFYVNAGTAFSPPSTLVVGERLPEESRQVEGGVKKQFLEGRILATLAVYRLERENIAIPDAGGVLRNNGDQISRGVELEVSAQHDPFWHTFFNYAYNDTELTRFSELALIGFFPPEFGTVDRSGNAAPFAPRHLLNLWSSKEFANGIGFGGGLHYVSGQFIAPDNLFEIDDYLTLDSVVSYRHQNWRLSVNFKNITDNRYLVRGFGNNSVIPADAFGAFATLQFTK